MTPLRRCVCNAASIRETLSRPDAIHTQVGRNAHRLLLLPRALPSRWGQGPSSVCKGGLTLQPEAVEQMQLRGRRRIDGVGRPEFDFYTGLRAGASRPYELARAARRAWSFGRGLSLHPDQSKPSDRAEASERDGAGAVLHGCCASCRRDESGLRTSVTERALHFTAAVQAVGASERDGAGAAGVAGRVHGFGATGGDTDLYGRLRVSIVGR